MQVEPPAEQLFPLSLDLIFLNDASAVPLCLRQVSSTTSAAAQMSRHVFLTIKPDGTAEPDSLLENWTGAVLQPHGQ